MSTITTRAGKGSTLTHTEVDNNFTNLNTDKYQEGDNMVANTISIQGGSSSQFLMADGSTSVQTGATVDDATALAIALG
jgi:hypothetical protein